MTYSCFVRLPLQPRLSLKVVDEAGLTVKQYSRRLPQHSSHAVVRSRHGGLQQCALLLSCVVHLHVGYIGVLCVPSTKHVDDVLVWDTSSSIDSMRQLTRCRPFVCLRVVSLDTTQRCSTSVHPPAESVQRRVNDCHAMSASVWRHVCTSQPIRHYVPFPQFIACTSNPDSVQSVTHHAGGCFHAYLSRRRVDGPHSVDTLEVDVTDTLRHIESIISQSNHYEGAARCGKYKQPVTQCARVQWTGKISNFLF